MKWLIISHQALSSKIGSTIFVAAVMIAANVCKNSASKSSIFERLFFSCLGACAYFCTMCYLCQITSRINEGCCSCFLCGCIPMRTKIRTERKIKVFLRNWMLRFSNSCFFSGFFTRRLFQAYVLPTVHFGANGKRSQKY